MIWPGIQRARGVNEKMTRRIVSGVTVHWLQRWWRRLALASLWYTTSSYATLNKMQALKWNNKDASSGMNSHYSPASDASSEMAQQSSCQASSCHLWVVQDAIPEYPGISVWEFHCHGNDAHPCLDNNIHGDSSNDKIISNKATTTTILYYYYL